MLTSPWFLPLMFVTGTAAGIVNAFAAGGGLVTLPALLLSGLPAQNALGTNKFQSLFGNFTSALYYIRSGAVSLRSALSGIIYTAIGAVAGAVTVQHTGNQLLQTLLPFLLAAMIPLTVLTPDVGTVESKPRIPRRIFFPVAGLAFGFFDGFFGPGVGSFWTIALMFGVGLTVSKAIAYSKVLNCTSNIVAVLLFTSYNFIWFGAGLVMASGQILGAWIGSRFVTQHGPGKIRPIFVGFLVIATMKLFYNMLF
ncbi:MAG: TSUP family transporter [Ignavibacteriales bacterium]|nr:TSUP family transporter [Ignavibacteriales bacterium]